jgi:hypothetical protein
MLLCVVAYATKHESVFGSTYPIAPGLGVNTLFPYRTEFEEVIESQPRQMPAFSHPTARCSCYPCRWLHTPAAELCSPKGMSAMRYGPWVPTAAISEEAPSSVALRRES